MAGTRSSRRTRDATARAQGTAADGWAISDFPRALSKALDEIGAEEGITSTHDVITARREDGSLVVEPRIQAEIVEALDKLAEKIQDPRTLSLSKVCREYTVLPKSYIISDVVLEMNRPAHTGTYADIWKGRRGGKDVCIKIFRKYEEGRQKKIKAEFYYHIIKWKHVSHENVLPFEGVSEIRAPFGLISPWMPNGNILKYTTKYEDVNRLRLLADAACGLKYLHSLEIVHSNIAPGNILITEEGKACIGDFEITGIITNPAFADIYATTTCQRGFLRYMAPEQVDPMRFKRANTNPTKEMDIHSFAMTVYEVLTGSEPYAGSNNAGQLTIAITSNERPARPMDVAAKTWLPDPIWKTIESCWTPEPGSRPSIDTVYKTFLRSATKVDRSTTGSRPSSRGGKPLALQPDEEAQVEPRLLGGIQGLMKGVRSFFHHRSAEQQ